MSLIFAASMAWFSGVSELRAAQDVIRFNRDIRPILAENCFGCHGPDPGTRKASLRLDQADGFFGQREGGPTIVRRKPEKSPLYRRLIADDPDEVMPPPKSRHALSTQQVALVRRWIAAGAPWEPHWSLINPVRPELPAVRRHEWVRNPIDRFALARLESAGLEPAPEAEARALVRRVSLDLMGLPPEPDLVRQFIEDSAPDRYEKLVDRLLASPRYGEHRARYWLDAARYGDTHGLNQDNYREIWPYRDWVIDAFNGNMPFDRFTLEQIAGDLLPKPTRSQLIATGFHRCNITTSEGGTFPDENLANYARDRVETTSWVWLGLTANCAVCHDHKFDPIPTKDFYAMSAFFRNTTQGGLDNDVRDTAPVLILPAEQDAQQWDALPKEIEVARAALSERRRRLAPEFERWMGTASPEQIKMRIEGNVVALPMQDGDVRQLRGTIAGMPWMLTREQGYRWEPGKTGSALTVDSETSLDLGDVGDFERDQPFSVCAWVRISGDGTLISRLEPGKSRGWVIAIKEQKVLVYLASEWPAKAIVGIAPVGSAKLDEWRHLAVTYDGSTKAEGFHVYLDGKALEVRNNGYTLADTTRTNASLRLGRQGGRACVSGALQGVNIFDHALASVEIRGVMRVAEALRSAGAEAGPLKEVLFDVFVAGDPETARILREIDRLEARKEMIRARVTVAPIQEERTDSVPKARVLRRGEYLQPGEEVGPAVFSALHPMPKNAPRNRLGLAQWLIDSRNPLTARVTVNRLWQEMFGVGLVRTSEDFGIMGEVPSHPELLDWLAVEFREGGWNIKHLIRLMVTSATYRQAAVLTPEKLERDPENRLLSRGPRFRMDAEMVRDYALAASGVLSATIGGASVKPYQPDGVWEAVGLPTSNTRVYQRDRGEGLYRRSLYTFWKRSAPPAAMEVFNAPTREVSCLRRERTNTPLQALATMNAEQFVEAARVLATRVLVAAGGDESKALDDAAQRVLCRSLRPEEEEIVRRTGKQWEAYYSAHPDESAALLSVGEMPVERSVPASRLAAWTLTCNQLMNLDEVLNK